jgi:hypothetical protein
MQTPTFPADDLTPWKAQPGPQTAFVESEVFEVVYGGARGGGKTDAALGDFARHAELYLGSAQGLLVRRTRRALEPTLTRARRIFGAQGAAWSESRSCFTWPSGARLYFRHLDNDADADLYQGHAYSRVYVEELTQFPSPRPLDKLKATLRSANGAPCGFRATCNPGGAGHGWVKARYIDLGPYNRVTETFENPFGGTALELDRLYIPARLPDNPALLSQDPHYVARLAQSGSKTLVRAWLEGDWNVVEGAFFDSWGERNVVKPFAIPRHWTRVRAFDWGFAAPFSVGWWAMASETRIEAGDVIQRGALVRYREWYGARPGTGEGLRLTAEEVARGILTREAADPRPKGIADPSIFAQNGGPSLGERFRRSGVYFRPGDNTRVSRLGAFTGWDQMRARIVGNEDGPLLVVFDTCLDFLRTVPTLQHDPDNLEDLDTRAEDHIADETRYACLSRPIPGRATSALTDWNDGRAGAGLFSIRL